MRTLIFAETDAITGGDNITLDEFRNGLRIATPIAGAVCGLLITNLFERIDPLSCLISASIGAIALHITTEISIGDKVWHQHQTKML